MESQLLHDQKVHTAPSDQITVSCYVNEIPLFTEAELARLYGHIHSSLAFFSTSRTTENVSTYVVLQGCQPTTLLLFQYKNGVVDVFNQMIFISQEEIYRFAQYIFEKFSLAHVICFRAIRTDLQTLMFPYQRHNSKEDWVINLPATPNEYTASLGKATRENVKRYSRRIVRDHPSFTQRFYIEESIDEQDIRKIIELSEARISAKKKKFAIDDEETKRIIKLIKQCGFANIIQIEGRLCAAIIGYRVGSGYKAEIVAHDSKYDRYWIGTLCYYMAICGSIVHGAKKFHMGGGRYEYKARLLGVRQDMDCVEIYRSYAHLAFNPCRVTKTAINSYIRRIKIWLLEHEKSFITQTILHFLYHLRNLGRWIG
jgi:hypothetical protein